MASREELLEQAGSTFSRTLSNHSIGRYAQSNRSEELDDDFIDDELNATVERLIQGRQQQQYEEEEIADGTGFEDELVTMKRSDYHEAGYEEDYDRGSPQLNADTGDSKKFTHRNMNSSDPYESQLCKPVVSVGKTTLGYSKAKMMGLCDNEGNFKMGKISVEQTLPASTKKRIEKLSVPRVIDVDYILDGIVDEDEIARKQAKEKAESAMRNPRCGYDFVTRLNERGDFLDRLTGKEGKGTKKQQKESDEQDYNARLDKLACPKCKRQQSFDEFYEKKRKCSQCGEKFVKLKLCHIGTFERRMHEAEKAKQEKLTALDSEVYRRPDNDKKFVIGKGLVGPDGAVVSSSSGLGGIAAEAPRVRPVSASLNKTASAVGTAVKATAAGTGADFAAQVPVQMVLNMAKKREDSAAQMSAMLAKAKTSASRPASGSKTATATATALDEEAILAAKFSKLTQINPKPKSATTRPGK